MLKTMAQRIHQALRKCDWAARIGGDEMLVVLYGLNDLAKAMLIGEKLRVAAHAPIDFGMQVIKVTISVGVTLATSANPLTRSLLAPIRPCIWLNNKGEIRLWPSQ